MQKLFSQRKEKKVFVYSEYAASIPFHIYSNQTTFHVERWKRETKREIERETERESKMRRISNTNTNAHAHCRVVTVTSFNKQFHSTIPLCRSDLSSTLFLSLSYPSISLAHVHFLSTTHQSTDCSLWNGHKVRERELKVGDGARRKTKCTEKNVALTVYSVKRMKGQWERRERERNNSYTCTYRRLENHTVRT